MATLAVCATVLALALLARDAHVRHLAAHARPPDTARLDALMARLDACEVQLASVGRQVAAVTGLRKR